MRIAMVGPFGLHPNKTMQSRALNLARPLVAQGHQVRLFMPPWQTPNEANQSWQVDGVDLRYVSLRGGVVATASRLVKETLAWQPHVVHCFKPKAYSGLVAWWLWHFHRHRLRLVVDSDDWEGWGGWNDKAPYTPVQKQFFAWQERWGLRHCQAVTVASRALQSLVWSHGVHPSQLWYIPNGPGIGQEAVAAVTAASVFDVERLASLGGRPTLLLYSRLFEFDTQRLVAVLSRVKEAVPEMAVLAVGSGLFESDGARFRQQLTAAQLDDAIVEVGWVDQQHLPSLLGRARAGIYLMEDTLLNRTKCPVKLADMLSVGVPVVGESVGQVSEYVLSDNTGYLHPQGDVAGIASSLVRLLRDDADQQRLSAGARAHIRQWFSWDRLARIAEQAYGGAARW